MQRYAIISCWDANALSVQALVLADAPDKTVS